MTSPKKLLRRAVLNDTGVQRVASMHPWIFRGNLHQIPHCNPGDIIAFSDRGGNVLGWGLWSDSALCIRVLTFGPKEPDQMALLRERITRALEWRKTWCPGEEAFRWVHGEADGLPGIVADLYGDVLSLQLSAIGWYRHLDDVAKTFRKVRKLSSIVLRNETKHLEKEGIPREVKAVLGEMPTEPLKVRIGSLYELVDIAGGQKTGAYLDVRHIPEVLKPLCKDARVLDCFSYQGHFGLHALAYGASEVVAVEQSQGAIDVARQNLKINGLPDDKMKWLCGNAFDIMRDMDAARERFDIVIMDPPPFSPGKEQLESARRGYKELAVRGLRRLREGGYLVFLSCSHAFTRDMLLETLTEAARDDDTLCRVALEIHQPQDHPALAGVPETDYLKGFVLGVRK
ncbi:MAG: class I SAM-dependent rRNA methyltransferase [Synergistaceae bacterium]|nr:class I SAM-dependent rRNA methyltransferase [Synergistaceae bacterium]